MVNYFIKIGEDEHGPFTIDQLKSKSLQKNSLVWRAGLNSWVCAQEIWELKVLFRRKVQLPIFPKDKFNKILRGKIPREHLKNAFDKTNLTA